VVFDVVVQERYTVNMNLRRMKGRRARMVGQGT